MFRQYDIHTFELSEADRSMGATRRKKHTYNRETDDDILRTTFSGWKKKKEEPKNYVKEYKNPVENFKLWWRCKGHREEDQFLEFLLYKWLEEKKIELLCQRKDKKCHEGEAGGIRTAYKKCKKNGIK